MKNLIFGLLLVMVVCVGCSKKEDSTTENMNHEGHKMPMDEDKNNE